ncbi:MAG: DNA primase [Candidatus Magasanikbacteria bacterium]
MSDTDRIKEKIDIVDLINEYLQMKPAGINHKGLCPFHQEKTPSFMASRERQNFHCFGCGKGGDVFTFVQEIEGMEFVDALNYLANKTGIELTKTFENTGETSKKQRLKDINTEAARFYNYFLTKMDASVPAREYLKGRGLTNETIEEWQIGFVPDQWDLLTRYLLKKGHSIDDLVESGLTIKRDGASPQSGKGFYDRFRGRVMFPIQNEHGSVVGFTGRVLVETEKSGGKYVNTPQTPVYDKSRVVFGLYKAKQDIRSKDQIVMVEGQLDVISVYQSGMKNVVATSGTAMTADQVKLLSRYSKNMNMAFDSDEAGVKAAKRGIEIALHEGMNLKVIHIPDGSGGDPDECVKMDKEAWFKYVENAESVMEWYFSMAFKNMNIFDPKQKQEITNQLLPEISLIPFAVEKDHWVQELSTRLQVEISVLREDLVRLAKKPLPEVSRAVNDEGQGGNQKKAESKKTRIDVFLERLISLHLRFPLLEVCAIKHLDSVGEDPFSFVILYKKMEKGYTNEGINIDSLRRDVHEDAKENIVDILLMKGELEFSDMPKDEAVVEVQKLSARVEKEVLKKRGQELELQIQKAERGGDKKELDILLREFGQL